MVPTKCASQRPAGMGILLKQQTAHTPAQSKPLLLVTATGQRYR